MLWKTGLELINKRLRERNKGQIDNRLSRWKRIGKENGAKKSNLFLLNLSIFRMAAILLFILGTSSTIISCGNSDFYLELQRIVEEYEAAQGLSIGDKETCSAGGVFFDMIYAQDQASISFPSETDDGTPATLTKRFWMAETEVTNAAMVEVLQWAYDNGKFSTTENDPNELSVDTVKHGDQELLNLDDPDCRVDYNILGYFFPESGYENNPVTDITWYGAVMFCNWLTEMRDGNTDNVVYTNIDTTWQDEETTENISRNGYRLPSSDEWEYAARYRGADSTNTVSGYSNPYYTKGNSASGAVADYNDAAACQAVAVYDGQNPSPTDEAVVKSLGAGSANALGLYDMSGNVLEWCFTENGSDRIIRGGSWIDDANFLQVGDWSFIIPDNTNFILGFRVCRTAD